jgi:cation diffusion facilitator family transporter
MAATPHTESRTRKVLYAGLIGNLLVMVTKAIAAAITQSSAMMSEAVHSLVDTSNEVLLLYGARQAKRPPDERHPLGHGREVYFWSFIVSLLIFTTGAGVSMVQGVHRMISPLEPESFGVAYAVLALAFLIEGASWWVAFNEFRRRKGSRGFIEAARDTKDPSTVIVFFEDSAALAGITLAFMGTGLAQLTGEPRFDAAASIAIGLLLGAVALFLARENKHLLIGEGARPALQESVAEIAAAERGVEHFNGMLSIQLAPREVVVALSIDFEDQLTAVEVQAIVARLETRIRKKHSDVVLILVKPQDAATYAKARHAWVSGERTSTPQ